VNRTHIHKLGGSPYLEECRVNHAPRTRRHRLLAAAAVVVAFGLTTVAPHAQAGTTPRLGAAVPTGDHIGRYRIPDGTPSPGAGFRAVSAYRVVAGEQIYRCETDATTGTSAWAAGSLPIAFLLNYNSLRTILHFGVRDGVNGAVRPRWRATADGSTVIAAVATRVPQAGTIPWLLLNVTERSADAGEELSAVTHISRVRTSGGVGPTGACDPATDRPRGVPYGADYIFWAPA
jgi:hypothetical protein